VHLLEPSHNKRFYALLGQFWPSWQSDRQQLRSGLGMAH
jgi:predicted metal-dependent hydrolase